MAITKIQPYIIDDTKDFTFNSVTATANLTANNANLGNLLTVNYVAGTLTTGAQPNITTVGTLGNLTVTSNVITGSLKTDNILYANGAAYVFSTNAAGANTQVQFNDANSFGASSNFTFDKSTNTLSITNIIANGAGLTSLTGANVTGTVANATFATTAGTANSVAGANVTGTVSNATYATTAGSASTADSVAGANVTGTVANATYATTSGSATTAGTVTTAAQPNITSVGTLASLDVTGNISASYFIGNGSQLTGLTAGNANTSNTAITVTGNAQPNITSVGTLTSLTVTGNITGGNLSTTGSISATDAIITGNLTVSGNTSYINVDTLRVEDPIIELGGGVNGAPLTTDDGKDRGSLLHYYNGAAIDSFMGWDSSNAEFAFGSNVSVANEVVTFNTLGNVRVQTLIGNVSATTVSANTGNITDLNVTGIANISGTLITGNVTAGAGTGGNITGANLVSANYFIGNFWGTANTATSATTAGTVTTAAQPNITSVGTLSSLTVTGNVAAGNLLTDSLRYANGTPYVFSSNAGGANTQVQFNNANAFAGSANFTFNNTTNTLSVTNIVANGSGLTSITGANVTGTVANATYAVTSGSATTAGTVTTNAQPNITSVGTLTDVTVTGNATVGTLITGNFTAGAGTGGNITGANLVSANYFIGNFWGTANLATVATTANSVAGANVTGTVANATYAVTSGSATTAGTVTTAAQPNITSVGSLTDLSVSGNAVITGNLTVNGNTNYINVETLRIEDPIIELGGGVNGAPLTNNDGKDRGSLLHYYNGAAVDAFMGWDNSNAEFAFGSNVSVTGEVVTYNSLGNVRALNFIGNAIAGNVFTDNLKYANGSSYVFTTNAAGTNTQVQFNDGNAFAGSANFTFDKTTNTLSVTNFVGNGSQLTGITASSSNTANTANTANSALTAGTVTTNAQPNITSTGTLTTLTVSGVSNLGNVGNVIITGGTTNAFLQTNGSGNLTWTQLYNAVVVDNFVGDGANSSFTLSTAPGSINNTMLNLGGVIQQRDSYAISGSTLTLDAPPAVGALIEVTTTSLVNAGAGTFVTRTYSGNGVANTFAVSTGSTASSLLVMINGVVQVPTTDYSVSSGNLVFVTPPSNVQTVQVREMAVAIPAGSSVSGSNTQVQFNDNGVLGATSGFTFNKSTNALSVGSVTATTFTGTLVGAATIATTAGTVTTAAQPNITSVGTLTSLAVTGDVTSGGIKLGYMGVPLVGADKTTSYTLATSDVGKIVTIGTGGSITIPDATFSAGDAISLFNNTAGTITVTCTITTAYIGGTDADKATVTLATRGIATILFISGTVCVITGNVT